MCYNTHSVLDSGGEFYVRRPTPFAAPRSAVCTDSASFAVGIAVQQIFDLCSYLRRLQCATSRSKPRDVP